MKTVLVFLCVATLVYTVTSSCVSCKYGTSEAQCTDPFVPSGSEMDICNTVNKALCKTYGDYAIYCQSTGSTLKCMEKGRCGSENRMTSSCVSCKYGTSEAQCTDPFVPSGSEMDICISVNKALCKKYGDYAIYCQSTGTTNLCMKKGQCGNSGGQKMTTSLILMMTTILHLAIIRQ